MPSAVNPSLVGRVLDGRYRVLSRIADGGMATVYLAVDTRLDREVALKVMRESLIDDEEFVARFRREARSAARLSHPHVVSVFDQGEDQGLMFLAMEFVGGKTLREVMRHEGALTPRAALDVIEPVLEALAAAHHAGLIHRDVKPENVILREDGMVKVADFGLARAVTSQTSTSQTGMLLGTVSYLSPEQVERGVADARSDVYAAGLILFEMLTGTKAYTGETPIHVAYQHVHSEVPPPSTRNPSVPEVLDDLVLRATARDPDHRPSDAGAFLAEVRAARAALSLADLDVRPEGALATVAAEAVTRTAAMPFDRSNGSFARSSGAAAHTGRIPGGSRGELLESRRDLALGQRSPWVWVAAALAVLVVVGLAVWYFLAGPGSPTTVPLVVNKPYAQAAAALAANDLEASRKDVFDEKVPKGIVVAAQPGSSTQVRRGSTVVLSVSKGPERYAVPKLVGLSKEQAEAALKRVRLAVGDVSEKYSETVPAGQVMSSKPEAGKYLKKGSGVALVVSSGKPPIAVQDFTGQPKDAAIAWFAERGLTVDADKAEFHPTIPAGHVISQDPPNGEVFKGDKITLVISKGPEMVPVPNVNGKQEAEAKQILEAAGFTVQVDRFMGGIYGTVRTQNPAADTQAPKGSTVTILVV